MADYNRLLDYANQQMKIYRIAELAVLWFVLSIVLAAAGRADDKAVQGWDRGVPRCKHHQDNDDRT